VHPLVVPTALLSVAAGAGSLAGAITLDLAVGGASGGVAFEAGLTTLTSTQPALPAWVPSVPLVGDFGLSELVETATGPLGVLIVFVYSFLIAFALPGVSEVVLFAPLDLGLSRAGRLTLIILVSSVGKAAGSVLAFHLGQEAKQSDPVTRWLRSSRWNVLEWSERRMVKIARRYGYVGLAAFLSVPGLPDTLSIYAFSVIETEYLKFTLATFIGSVNRLVITLAAIEGVLFLI
jgi:membrane protein YqaA with SNARE-associated domain